MEKMLERQQINVQSNTPVLSISDEKDSEGYFTVKTKRGEIKAKTIVHANVSFRRSIIYLGLTIESMG